MQASAEQAKLMPGSSFKLRCQTLESVRLRKVFDHFDGDADGLIKIQELSGAVYKLGLSIPIPDLSKILQPFLLPSCDSIDFDGFVKLHKCLGQRFLEEEKAEEVDDDEDLKHAFQVFDVDSDGYISAEELQGVLQKLSFAQGNEIDTCYKMITVHDLDHDGKIDFSEFKNMMGRVVAPSPSSPS